MPATAKRRVWAVHAATGRAKIPVPVCRDEPDPAARLEARLRAGEAGVLGDLFALCHDRLRRVVELRLDPRLRARVEPEDVLQETCIAALSRLEHFRKKDMSFFVWARMLALQTLIDTVRHLEAKKRAARLEISLQEPQAGTVASLASRLPGAFTSPSQAAARAERDDQIAAAIGRLAERDREILLLRHFEELTNDEVAQTLGIHKAAATNRYVRALRRLEAVLAELPEFDPEAGR